MSLAVCVLINISINIIVGTMSPAMINERDFAAGFLSFRLFPPVSGQIRLALQKFHSSAE